MQPETLGGLAAAADLPAAGLEDVDDVPPFHLFECGVRRRGGQGPWHRGSSVCHVEDIVELKL